MRFLILAFAVVAYLLPEIIFAQKKPSDYVVIDSAFVMGSVSMLRNGEVQFQQNKNDKPTIYDANDILEFGYNGKVFESMIIHGNRKFAERIVNEQVKLYKTQANYLIKTDSNLFVLSADNFRDVFSAHFTCDGAEDAATKLDYTKVALRTYIKAFNRVECDLHNFPHSKFGVYAGVSSLQFNVSLESSVDISENALAPSVGLFYDLPLFRPRALYFTVDVNSIYANPLFYSQSQGSTTYLALQVLGASSSVNAKWMFMQQGVRAYLKAGALFAFVATSSPNGLIKSVSNGAAIEVSRVSIANANDIVFGANTSVGVEIPHKGRKNFHLEARYQKVFNGAFDSFTMNFSGYSLVAGYNF